MSRSDIFICNAPQSCSRTSACDDNSWRCNSLKFGAVWIGLSFLCFWGSSQSSRSPHEWGFIILKKHMGSFGVDLLFDPLCPCCNSNTVCRLHVHAKADRWSHLKVATRMITNIPSLIISIQNFQHIICHLEHLQQCSVCDPAKICLTSKFRCLFFSNTTHKTKTAIANRWETTNSKPAGPMNMIGQQDHIYYTLL
jgi:hypothetical protein